MHRGKLVFSLAFPVLVLFAITAWKAANVMIGKKIILPVVAFDPRDLLSGHYLTYRIQYKYENPEFCSLQYGEILDTSEPGVLDDYDDKVYACLYKSDKNSKDYITRLDFDRENDKSCEAIITGYCDRNEFRAENLEKFFIPEEEGLKLEKAIRKGRGEIVISVMKNGSAVVNELLIDGKSWKYLENDETGD
ncbi:MAG: GDYXXLXY domain-containing protein [Spirochaetia bacterium]|nr:GDYXXLXY domain-containing protein [Spirochaetia bacterium]